MPGFLGRIGSLGQQECFNKNTNFKLINDLMQTNDLFIERRTVNKFIKDKVFQDNEDYFVLTEGIILNLSELKIKYRMENLFDIIIEMYNTNGNSFFNEFRGSFSGVFYDKKLDKKIIYTNHIGDKQVFYSMIQDEIVFGSEVNYIIDYYSKNKLSYSLNREGAYYLLTFGYMIEESTLFKEIKKLTAGHYMLVENNKIEIIQYYKLNNAPNNNYSEDEMIENIDMLFRQAVKRAFDKDLEYGYKHLVGLSGGLDSRMTTWVANRMGYDKNIINFTFSQSDYLDEIIPKKIASDLKHEWIFKSLDNGIFLKSIEDIIKISSGGALYYGLSHGKSCLDLIDKDKFGIIHTGQLGDVVIGTFYSSLDINKGFSMTDGVYSNLLTHKLDKNKLNSTYDNEEIFKFYARAFTGANQGLLVAQETTETYSPFYDLEFLEYCIRIPVEFRFNHRIYFNWILKKYPEAAKYKWEKINGKITDKRITIRGRDLILRQLPKIAYSYIMRKFGLSKSSLETKNHMNPLDYWYNTNKDLKEFMDNYYENNIYRLNFDDELKKDCEYLYFNGTNIEKNQVLTLLAALKIYF